MKRVLVIFATLSAIIILSTGAILAQSTTMIATIPFDFSVGDVMLSGGEYSAKIVGGSLLVLQSKDGGPGANVLTIPITIKDPNQTRARLVFARYGDVYFLRQAVWPGYDHAYETSKSKHEVEIARNRNNPKELILTGDSRAANLPR